MKPGKKTMMKIAIAGMIAMLAGVYAAPAQSPKPADPFVKGNLPVAVDSKVEEGKTEIPPPPPVSKTIPMTKASEEALPNKERIPIRLVEIDTSLVAFPKEFIESLARGTDSAAPTEEQIIKAWRDGKGRLVASQKSITKSGAETITKGVAEHIHPRFVLASESAVTNAAGEMKGVFPNNFEIREVGMISAFVPEISNDGPMINLTMEPQYVSHTDHEIVSPVEPMEGVLSRTKVIQPEFFVQSVSYSATFTNGQTIVAGGMATQDGKEMSYFFITPRVKTVAWIWRDVN